MHIAKTKKWIVGHKKSSIAIALAAVLVFYWGYGKIFGSSSTATKYVVAAVEKGTIISSISGSGQVSASNQVDLQAKVSGNIIYVGAKVGDRLSAGSLIAQIDSHDAEIALENAKISLEKLTQPADKVSMLQAQNSLNDAISSNQKAYDDGFNNVTAAFVDIPNILSGLKDLTNYSSGYLSDQKYINNDTERRYTYDTENSYAAAQNSYDKAVALSRTITRTSASSSIAALIKSTYETAKATAQAVKDAKAAVSFIQKQEGTTQSSSAAQDDVDSWTPKINGHLQSLASSLSSIDSSTRSVTEQTASLAKLKDGADPLDIQAQELNVRQKQYAYNDSFIRAPFDGVLAAFSAEQGDSVNSGTSLGTFITEKKIADISLNEVDVAKVHVGQKATLTFDAIDGLSITGQVVQVDLVGTASQGVVSYNVKIGFDTQDERIKSGMSVSASIITEAKQDVLVVPNSAIKNQGGSSYVEMVNGDTPVSSGNQGAELSLTPAQQTVQTGVTDDTNTEIVSGLKVGDKIIVKTVSAATAKTASAPSIFGAVGAGNRGGLGGGARAAGR